MSHLKRAEKFYENLLSARAKSTGWSCPRCREVPLQVTYARGVEVDWCEVCHGVYFDKGELEVVRDGADRAKPSGAIEAAEDAADVFDVLEFIFDF